MRVYLDLCCLKRPFDDQSQVRVHLESEAILALLSAAGSRLELVHTRAHDLENEQNKVPTRAARVREWLSATALTDLADGPTTTRTAELVALGFKSFDAFHLASAEGARSDAFATCDDRLLAAAHRHAAVLRIRVVKPVDLATEVLS
jgi:hypothetical protein